MARKKKKRKQPQPQKAQLSPESYIRKKARNLPLAQCYISETWESAGKANIIVSRAHKNGNFTAGFYLIDLKCLGVKNTLYLFNVQESMLDEIINQDGDEVLIPCDYHLAHHIIFGAKKFAESYGLQPHKSWTITKNILEKDDESIPFVDIEFGENGMPHYISGPDDDIPYISRVINTLKKTAGEGNYQITIDARTYGRFDDDDGEEEDVDEEEESTMHEALVKSVYIHKQLFPDEKPKIVQEDITSGVIIDDEKYDSYFPEEEVQNIKSTISALAVESTATQHHELQKLQNKYSDSTEGLLLIYFISERVLKVFPTEIGNLIEQKYPDLVSFNLLRSIQFSMMGNPEKARKILGDSLTIQEQFPHREGFSFSEWVYFLVAMMTYFMATDDIATALSYAVILTLDIEGMEEEYPFTWNPLTQLYDQIQEKFSETNLPDIPERY